MLIRRDKNARPAAQCGYIGLTSRRRRSIKELKTKSSTITDLFADNEHRVPRLHKMHANNEHVSTRLLGAIVTFRLRLIKGGLDQLTLTCCRQNVPTQ